MRRHRDERLGLPEFEHIAQFGQAELVRDLNDRYELRGGSAADRAAAHDWNSKFLHAVIHVPPQIHYTILPRPPRPSKLQPLPIPDRQRLLPPAP